jgi:soluble cytochrome b562
MEAFERIAIWIADLQRALSRDAASVALWRTVILLALSALLSLGLAAWLGPGAGRWAWLAPGLALTLSAQGWIRDWWSLETRRDAIAAARYAEAELTAMNSGLVTALQSYDLLRDQGPAGWPAPSMTLACASAERTLSRVNGIAPGSLVDPSRALSMRRAGLGSALALGALVWFAPPWLHEGIAGLTAPVEQSKQANPIELALSDLSVELRFPGYLHLETRTLKGTRGDVSAISGTTVQISGRPTVPTQRAELLLDLAVPTTIPMTTVEDGTVSGSFMAREAGRYRIALIDAAGERSEEKTGRVLDVRADEPPMIRLLRPEADLEVREGDPVSIAYEASDDHGVSQIALWIDGPIGEPERRQLRRGLDDRVVKGVDEIGMSVLGLSPGESAEIWLEVSDSNDVTGPGVGRSTSRRIWMFSPEVEHARRLSDLEGVIDAMIGLLADRLESPVHEESPERVVASVIWHQAIVTASATVVTGVEGLIGALNTDTLASDALRELLTETLANLRGHREQEDAQLRRAVLSESHYKRPKVLLRIIAQTNDEATGDLEKNIFRLKDELDRSRQDQVLEEGRDLLEQQESLRELMARIAQGDTDPELAAEAERQLDQLEASLKRMAKELSQLAERSPYENQNPSQRASETEEDVDSMQSEMDAIRKLLREGKVEEAMKRLEELNKSTQEWMASLDEDFGEREGEPSPHRRALTEFQMELSEVTDGQRGVEGETGAETAALKEERLKALEEELADLYEEALAASKALAKLLTDIEGESLHASDRGSLDEARLQGRATETMVETKRIQEALETLRHLIGALGALAVEIGESEERESKAERGQTLRLVIESLAAGEVMGRELEVLLEKLLERMERPPSPSVKRRLGGISKRQRALRRAVGLIEGKLGSVEEAIPGIGEELAPSLEEARRQMRAAREALEQGTPGRAQGHQRAALDELSDAQSQFEKSSKNAQGSSSGGQGLKNSRDDVAIPEGDSYAAPEAFRRELIEAMKERAPAGYEEAVRRYYEELTR